MKILIVRLGALGDIVHTVPAAAALRRAFPAARIEWIVDARHAGFLELVTPIDRIVRVEKASGPGWVALVRELRRSAYDVALDFQGLMKSAALARASGAGRAIGFSIGQLREKGARPFYSHVERVDAGLHVVEKNLALLAGIGVFTTVVDFPLSAPPSAARDEVVEQAHGRPVALINPGAAWPNKRWPPSRFAEVAVYLREARGLCPVLLWGPGEEPLARQVVNLSRGAAIVAPATTTADLVALSGEAALMVSGDTGPLHIAAAVGTPIVAIFGPTNPARNGPWISEDITVSRFEGCRCHYQRRCHDSSWCLNEVHAAEVAAAIQRRLSD
jgi:lipopolysaccharide heptosyltransferase I